MTKKCYDLRNLQKYQNKTFIYERKLFEQENTYNYESIIQEITKCLECFKRNQLKHGVGIAIDVKEHTAASCISLLSVLNYDCHFYCLDFEETKDVATYLRLSGVQYAISLKLNKEIELLQDSRYEFKIFNKTFYLYALNSINDSFENVRLFYTIATSGSTGIPKMVHVPYQCIEPNIKSLSSLLDVTENDVIYLHSPVTFDPFVVELFLALENGASILITTKEIRLQPENLLKIMFPEKSLEIYGVTIYQTTPSLFRLFGKENISDVILNNNSSLRCLLLGGEAFPVGKELNSWLPSQYPNKRIFNIYGITEVSCWSSIYEATAKDIMEECGTFPLGKSLDDFTFLRLVNECGNVLLEPDCLGELEIGSSFRRCFIPQFDHDIKIMETNDVIYRKTGDLVRRDKGELYYIGRSNNTIKRLGKRMCLDALNKKVEEHLNHENLLYKPIYLWQQESLKLTLYLQNEKDVNTTDTILIPHILKKYFETHEQPDKIIYGHQWPLNRHGKLDTKQLLEMITDKENPYNTPEKIFKEFLSNTMGLQLDVKMDGVDVNQPAKRLKLCGDISFTKAGGSSFQALSLATEIGELLEDHESQRKILEMLLDNNISIKEIIQFLNKARWKIKENLICDLNYKENLKTNFNLKLLWRNDLKKCIDSAPSIYQNKFVSVGSHSHLIKTMDALTSQEISTLELNDRIECPVVFVSSQLALVGCYDGFLYGFDFIKGSVTWKLNAKGMIKAKPLVVNNIIIIASYAEDYNVKAFDLKTLTLKWHLKLGSKGIFSSPVQISESLILICCLDGSYALVESETGAIKWLQKLDSPIFSTAAKIEVSNETFLIIAEVKGKISVCKAENGQVISSFQALGNIFSGITLHHMDNLTLIIFGCHDKNVYCLNFHQRSKELTLNWFYSLNSAVYSTPILITNNFLLVCSTQGLMVLFELLKPKVLASYDLKAEIFSTPSCLNDTYIYVGCRDNYLYAFELKK